MSKVVLFGLDGATYTVLDDLVARGMMPTLAEFMRTGVRAKMLSVKPPLTPPAWSTLVTGRTPGHHGVTGFFQYDAPDSLSIQLISSRQLVAETIWSMVNRQGKRAGSLNFVAHQPAPKIDGWVIPGWVSWRWIRRLSHPSTLIDKLKAELPGFDVKSLAIDFEEERKAIVGAPIDDYKDWVGLHINRETQWFNVMKHQMLHDPVDLVGVVYDGVDKLQHLLWPYLDPALTPAEPDPEFLRIRSLCWDYFRNIDNLLKQTMELAGPNTTIFICSDHGFTGSWEILFINNWLEERGYLTWKEGTEAVQDDNQELEPSFYRLSAFDLTRTKAYALTASSNGIYISVKGRKDENGIPPEEYESFRRKLIDELLNECVDPETGEKLITNVWTREEIFDGPMRDIAPDLTLALRDYGFVSVRRNRRMLAKRPQILGTHHPEGVLIARGPGIRQGAVIDDVHLLDVAPTALYSMGLSIPADLQGRVLNEIYTPEFLEAHKLRRGEETKAVAAAAGADAPGDEEAEILEKLKALGYIE